jgi:hypothetical protein
MATARPFAYNIGAGITGTDQIGGLAIGTPTYGFASTGLQWWNGPDEDLGYVIAASVPGNRQPTQVPDDAITLSTVYKGTDISLSNNNQTANQVFSYSQTVLGETLISGTDKVMFSVQYTSTDPSVGVGGHFIGVGLTGMNYSGPFNGYPGNDTNSIGFSDDGNYYYNGASVQSGLPTWTSGDIIDIAISSGQRWWIRVNGGNWNSNPAANPTTGANGSVLNGLTNFYPALCPYIYGTMQILNYPKYGVPSDYNFLGNVSASVGFFRSSALTDPSFISLADVIAGPSGGGPFASGSAAKTWLNANGYWTSYVGATGSTGATGDFNVTITQVGNDVVWSGSGSFNLTSLTLDQNIPSVTGGYNKSFAQFIVGPASSSSATTYGGSSFTTFPTNFGSGPGTAPSSSSGSLFGVVQTAGPTGPRVLLVPQGYVSGTAISGSMTYNSQTISGMGLSGGTYTWAWGSGADASSLVMVIGGTGSTGATGATGSTGATGGGYALIITPYNPPAAGKTIFPNFGVGATAGILNPNTFATGGVYWNPIDSSSVNQTSYYNGMLTRSVTASFTQNGNTAIYSGVTGAFVFIPATGPSDASFAYNPSQDPGKLTLIQASPVNFTLGGTVYISYT